MMGKICLVLMRFLLSFWVGSAVLFVITGVVEVTTPSPFLTSPVKDVLVTVRFPSYYVVGCVCVGIATLCGLIASFSSALPRKRMVFIFLLSLITFIMMVVDYQTIYSPLAEMVTPPGKARDMNFESYHKWSMYINTVDVAFCLIAALLACLPVKEKAPLPE